MFARIVGRFAVVLCLGAAVGGAQSNGGASPPSSLRTVAGTIADPQGHPVSGVEIALVDRDTVFRRSLSDSSGRFRMDAVPQTPLRLRVRHLGFETQTLTVDRSDKTTTVFVKLEPAIVVMDGMAITADPTDTISGLLRGFYLRSKTSHMGHFIDEQRMAELKPEFTSDALRTVPGVTVRPARIGNEVRIRGCAPLVWLDGMRAKGAQVDELGPGRDVAAIEVYESQTGVPAEFTDRSATCGTILIWLKSR